MNILLADDHTLFRDGLKLVLAQLGEDVNVLEADCFIRALEQARAGIELDLAMLDLNMPGMDGPRSITGFREAIQGVPVVVISASEEAEDVTSALDAGAVGYIPKSYSSKLMLSALRMVLDGWVYVPPLALRRSSAHPAPSPQAGGLSERQLEVLRLLTQGKSNKVIARELQLSVGTVKIHLAAIYRTLNVNNRTEAALEARRLDLIREEKK